MKNNFDVIVIGAGHAGCEAALASARMGIKTLLITINIDKIAHPPCNPSIGGVGKSHLVAEIDALGGEMAVNTDKSSIHWRYLNTSKGHAVRALRVQIDKNIYKTEMLKTLQSTNKLSVRQGIVSDIIIENKVAIGIKTLNGLTSYADKIIVTGGTFLKGRIHIGNFNYSAGRSGELSSNELSDSLKNAGISLKRLKTGTPARIDGKSINFDVLKLQDSLNEFTQFSNQKVKNTLNLKSECFIAKTNAKTKKIILDNIKKSAMYSGNITGIGPRYCPSIEDKTIKFSDKDSHTIFVEPEGFYTDEYYLSGLSTSFPMDIQQKIVNSIEGFKNAKIKRPGYAIEYDAVDSTELKLTLESKIIKNLYFAGQINGTSGYEEAAAQGIVSGINAALSLKKKQPFIPSRENSYIGVLIHDIVNKKLNEPYRLFTSRAENRLYLRTDNAEDRLISYGYKFGLINKERIRYYLKSKRTRIYLKNKLKKLRFKKSKKTLFDILKRPDTTIKGLKDKRINISNISDNNLLKLEIEIKYSGYLLKQKKVISDMKTLSTYEIPVGIDYSDFKQISYEAREKLNNIKPTDLYEASKISGVSPSDIFYLMKYLKDNRV